MSDAGEDLGENRILSEHAPEAGLLLWSVARDVVLWGRALPEARTELFAAAAAGGRLQRLHRVALPREVTGWLDILVGLLHASHVAPGLGVVTKMCQSLAGWARAGAMSETALSFAQAAAIVEPANASAALLVGEMAAAFGRLTRAESWYQRTVAVARRAGDWRSYAGAYHRMGDLALRRGRAEHAEAMFRKSLRAARRTGNRGEGQYALIGLMRVAIRSGRMEEAREWEARAAKAVRGDAAAVAVLAEAAVDLWMLTGDYRRALDCLRPVCVKARTPATRMHALARTAHAAAGAEDRGLLVDAWSSAWELAMDRETAGAAHTRLQTYLELHRAAALEGDEGRAERAIRAAADLGVVEPGAIERARMPVRRRPVAPAST